MSGDLGASMMSELPGSHSAAGSSATAHATPVVTIERTVRTEDSDGTEFTAFEVEVSVSAHSWQLRKRYSEFEELHRHLLASYSDVVAAERWPSFPEKTWLSRFDENIVETRRQGLQVFMQAAVGRTLYPVLLDARLRSFLELDGGLRKAIELEAAQAAALAASVSQTEASAERASQRRRRAHDAAVRRDRDHSSARQSAAACAAGAAVDVAAAGPAAVRGGVVIDTPLVSAQRRYVASVALAAAAGGGSGGGSGGRAYAALCAACGIPPPMGGVAQPLGSAAPDSSTSPESQPAGTTAVGGDGLPPGCGLGGCGPASAGLLVCLAAGLLAIRGIGSRMPPAWP